MGLRSYLADRRETKAEIQQLLINRNMDITTLEMRGYFQEMMITHSPKWMVHMPKDVNDEYEENIDALRKTSRLLNLQDAYAQSYMKAVVTNVIGSKGIRFRPKVKRGKTIKAGMNESVNAELLRAYTEFWTAPTVNKKGTGIDLSEQVLTTTVEDGECFINVVINQSVNKTGMALEIIDAALLDPHFNETIKVRGQPDRRIRNGIEIDKFDRPVAYHFWNKLPNSKHDSSPQERVVIPALDLDKPGLQGGIIQVFYEMHERPGALRGTPWMRTVLHYLARLNQYINSEIITSLMASLAPAYITTDLRDGASHYRTPTFRNVQQDVLKTGTDGNLILPRRPEQKHLNMKPGSLIELKPGQKLEVPNFDRPNSQMTPITKLFLHAIAASLGISFSTLTADTSEETYASGRIGVIQEREHWKRIQQWFIRSFHLKVYEAWLRTALISGTVVLPTQNPTDYQDVMFRARGWVWADPLRDVKAQLEQVKTGTKTLRSIADEFGEDWSEIIKERAEEIEMMSEMGMEQTIAALFGKNTQLANPSPKGTTPKEDES